MGTFETVAIGILNAANDLKRLPRTGWLLAGIAAPESIADHSYATAVAALMLACEINRDPAAQGLESALDVEVVLRTALVHDLPESLVTDLPHRATRMFTQATKHNAEKSAIRTILGESADAETHVALWSAYQRAATPEARVVRDADKLELLHQALRYEQSGAAGLDEFWNGHSWHYPASAALAAHLVSGRGVRA